MLTASENIRSNLIPRVSLSESGYLYLIGGSNTTIDLYDAAKFTEGVPIDQWRQRVAEREARFRALSVPWRFVLAPEKLSIYGDDELPRWIDGQFQAPGEQFLKAIHNDNLIYPREFLREQAKKYDVYSRTDSHWSSFGAFFVFQALCRSLGLDIDCSTYWAMPEQRLFYRGDLWSPEYHQIKPELFLRRNVDSVIESIYKNPVVGLKEKNGLENEPGLHVGSHAIWRNPKAELNKKVILFGSSFSEARLECTLLSYMFALYFRELHFIWSSSIDMGYVVRHRPDAVIVEMPERFLTQCPPDNLCIEEMGARIAQKWTQV